MATQNPIEYEGTYPLPEAQLDRFLLKMKMGYPDIDEEMEVLNRAQKVPPIEDLYPVIDLEGLLEPCSKKLKKYLLIIQLSDILLTLSTGQEVMAVFILGQVRGDRLP